MLGIGLDQGDVEGVLPFKISFKRAEHINASFDPPGFGTLLMGIAPGDVHNRDPREVPLVVGGASILGDGVLATADKLHIVFCQLSPWEFDADTKMNLKRTKRNVARLVTRLLANLGVASETPLLNRLVKPVEAGGNEKRWLTGFYLDQPEEWDDPYRFFRW